MICNLGSPDAPTPAAVRRFLKQMLWDPRIVEMPRLPWWLILHGIILRTRPRRVAPRYAKSWTEDGSPLLQTSRQQVEALESELARRLGEPPVIALGMRYGHPSIPEALETLRDKNCRHILVFPLFPQYSCTTTASAFDAVAQTLQGWRWVPELRWINHYYDEGAYIDALAASIGDVWEHDGQPQRLLFSFHGTPLRYSQAGDPYRGQCEETARLVAAALELDADRWAVAFQSRFGGEPWLQPYTDELLLEWARDGVKQVDVVCPGFAADCLETLEEIVVENKDRFMQAGGDKFRYIMALNDRPEHIAALATITERHLRGWITAQVKEIQ